MTLACPYCGQTAGAVAVQPIYDLSPFWPWHWRRQVGGIFGCCNCARNFKYRRGVVSRFEQPAPERAPSSSEVVPDPTRQREPSRVPVGGDDDMPFRRRPIR